MIYLPISLGAALLFFLAASLMGTYPTIARVGGMVCIDVLSLIVRMTTVVSRVRRPTRKM